MLAYKGFNERLECTRGKGVYQYEVGKTYREDAAQCQRTGFHCVEEPIEVLRWYSGEGARYCAVEAAGDIHEDGDRRISCTEMHIVRELTLEQIGLLECEWIMAHGDRKCSEKVERETGRAEAGGIVIVRGKHPQAAGGKDATIFLLKEGRSTREIVKAGVYRIDGEQYKPEKYYTVEGREAGCRKKC